jgi:hypothetical protein
MRGDSVEIKLTSQPPTGDNNGLTVHTSWMNAMAPNTPVVAVVVFDRAKVVWDDDKHQMIPYVRVRRAELMSDREDAEAMLRLLQRQYERRTGQTTLPLELEIDIKTILEQVDNVAAESGETLEDVRKRAREAPPAVDGGEPSDNPDEDN